MIWKHHTENSRSQTNFVAGEDRLFSPLVAPYRAASVVTQRSAVLHVVTAVFPKPSFNDVVSIQRIASTTDYALVPITTQNALTKCVSIQQFGLIVLDRHGTAPEYSLRDSPSIMPPARTSQP